jgi:hypothetical protein
MNHGSGMPETRAARRGISRRTVTRGVAWSAPLAAISVAAPAYAASQCGVLGGITIGPNVTTSYRAICEAQSQWVNPGTIKAVYGTGQLPQYLDICTCDGLSGWYRWRETDTLSNFQIEVDGLHSDQNGPNQGYRPAIFLDLNSPTGACKRFALTYRTSAERSKTNATNFSITWTLQRSTSGTQNGPWTQVETFTRSVSIIRTTGTDGDDQTNFGQCTGGGSQARSAATPSAKSGD